MSDSAKSGNNKPFSNYVKSKRTDNIGDSGIKSGGFLYQDSKSKANSLNQQFKSVLTKEHEYEKMPDINCENYPNIQDI